MCDEEDKVKCSNCENYFDVDSLNNEGICARCHELDESPTSNSCEQCDNPAIKNICGTDLCEDCLEHYHY